MSNQKTKKEKKVKGWVLKSALENNSQSLKIWLDKCPDNRYNLIKLTYTL